MKRLLIAAPFLLLLGAGCNLNPAPPPITTYEECVARGFPANAGLGECRANEIIYYRYGSSTVPTTGSSTVPW